MDRLFRDGTLTGLGDGQLLERYLTRRDEDAFEALVDLHGPMVLGLCRRMLRDPRDIEDAFQATFLVLVRKAPAIQDRNLLSNWLYGVAYRVARRARTRTLRRRDRESTVGEVEAAAGPERPERPEFDPTLDQELSRLPEKYRVPLVLCYLRGRTHDQAAEELRCPVGTVRSRLARGRDLLRKRLTRRGFAPTTMAAILGSDPISPARLLVATVPPPMAAATVRAAVGFGSSPTLKAGAAAASSLALTRGVLTTMKLAQIKWIGLAALATSLSAGSVVAVGYASAPVQQAATTEGGPSPGPEAQQPAGPRATEERLKALEDKIDRLMNRLDAASPSTPMGGIARTPAGGFEPTPLNTGAGGGIAGRLTSPPTATAPIRELEAQLKLAMTNYDRARHLFQRRSISGEEFASFRGQVLVLAARLEAIDDDVKDEQAWLLLELRRKDAELQRAQALEEVAGSLVARNSRLNERKPGMVAAEDVAKAEAERKVATAGIGIASAELAEVKLRIRQLQERQDRVRQAVALVDRAKRDAEKVPGAPPAPPANP
jgi:RNA polymerase sigma factor (sigma-70 family)